MLDIVRQWKMQFPQIDQKPAKCFTDERWHFKVCLVYQIDKGQELFFRHEGIVALIFILHPMIEHGLLCKGLAFPIGNGDAMQQILERIILGGVMRNQLADI